MRNIYRPTLDTYIILLKKNDIRKMDFIKYFNYLLDKKGLTTTQVYKNALLSRQTFSKIYSEEIKPSLKTAVKLAFGLKCSNDECKMLLKKLDYTLSSSSRINCAIRYCLDYEIYDLIEVDRFIYDNCDGKTLEDLI